MFELRCGSFLQNQKLKKTQKNFKKLQMFIIVQRIHEVGGTWENISYNKKMYFFWESAGDQNHRPGLLESNLMVIDYVFYAANDPPDPSELGERSFSNATSSKK